MVFIEKIKTYRYKYNLNDIIKICEISKNPTEYIKKIEPKIVYNNEYYISKDRLLDLLIKAKASKAKDLLYELKILKKELNDNTINTEITANNNINTEITTNNSSNFFENNHLEDDHKSIDFNNNFFNYNNNKIKYFYYNDNIYFKAKDIAILFDYVDTNQSIREHVDSNDKFNIEYFFKNSSPVKNTGDNDLTYKINKYTSLYSLLKSDPPNTIYINESGLYSLMLSSKKTEAKKIRHWITSEVLLSIRKYGYYKYDNIERYYHKDCVYVLHIIDNLYKYGKTVDLNTRVNTHKNIINFNKIIKIYECDNTNAYNPDSLIYIVCG